MKTDANILERPPIVVVLGHVDHGKSTILDYIRKSNVVETEAGGITQHVAAYEVSHRNEKGEEKRITFIDTPGHAAFRAIRARGASIADIAILVVAADDGVKAQTLEALESVRASGIPFVVAINKIDKPNADVEKTKHSLLENGIYIEGLGGDVPYAPVSAKTGEGIPELLNLILLVAELEEFKGDTNKSAEGFVIEAHRDPKRGIAATLIITDGTVNAGEFLVSGKSMAPLRIMCDFTGGTLPTATFSTPVTVIGFDDMPAVGAPFSVHKTKRAAEEKRDENIRTGTHVATLPAEEFQEGVYVMPLIVKADVAGSLEAVIGELEKLSSDRARVRVVHTGIGDISESDIKAAIAGEGAAIVGFNVEVDPAARDLAYQYGIATDVFPIIYELTEHIASALKEHTPRRKVEKKLGRARTLKVFSRQRDAHVLGGKVIDGLLQKGALVRVLHKGEEVGIGEIINMQSGKQNVDRVESDSEFGAQIEANFDISENDTLECFVIEEE